MGDCDICHGSSKLKVGWTPKPRSTYGVHIKYDPCPNCTAPPHSFHAKQAMAQIIAIRLRDSLQATEASHG